MTYPLLTKRLTIRPLSDADKNAFVAYRQDPEIARFQSWDPAYSLQQATDLIDAQSGLEFPAKGEWLQLAVHEIPSGDLVGDLALHNLQNEDADFEIGFTISKNHQGKGFAKEAASRLIDFLFLDHGATKLIAQTDQRNIASIRLLDSLGFLQDPAKSWNEQFKGEEVTVNYFFLLRSS